MTGQSGGSGSPSGTAGGVLAGTYPSPTYAGGGSYPPLSSLTAYATVPVGMPSASVWVTGVSLVIPIGTWQVDGMLLLSNTVASQAFGARLFDGTTSFGNGEGTSGPIGSGLSLAAWDTLVIAAPITLLLQAICANTGGTINATPKIFGNGNIVTRLRAVRIA